MPAVTSTKSPKKLNTMISVWYGIIIGILQAYLVMQSVRKFVWFAELSWPYQKTPFIELNVYIALTGVAVLLLPFFVAASFLQIGNTANDNRQLGKNMNPSDEWSSFLTPSMLYQETKGFFKTIWTHSGPTSSFIHVISSFCLLLPQTIMEAVLIKCDRLPIDKLWQTDLEFMIPQGDRTKQMEMLNSVDGGGSKIEREYETTLMDYPTGMMRLEYVNYGLALSIYSLRYASVYWHSSKLFSTLFSLSALISTSHSLITFSTCSVLYKLHVVGSLKILRKGLPFLLNSSISLLLLLLTLLILLGSSSVLYHYGYLRVGAYVERKVRATAVTGSYKNSLYGISWNYFPLCSALAVLLALASVQSPLFHDATLLYRFTLDNCMLTYIVSSAAHFLSWMILWLCLTTKQQWNFNVNVNIGNIHMKGLESFKLAANICIEDSLNSSNSSSGGNPMSSSLVVLSNGEAYSVSDSDSKRAIIRLCTTESCSITPNPNAVGGGESGDRIYWPRPLQPQCTVNSLDDGEQQPWLNEGKEAARSKVTFYGDADTSRKFSSVPLTRGGGLKRSFREKNYSELSQREDEGDYAVLKRGKGCLKNQLPREVLIEQSMSSQMSPIVRQQMSPYGTTCPPVHHNTMPQTTPRCALSTDSGYTGTVDSTGRSESRSASSTGSPPDRTASSDSSSAQIIYRTRPSECCDEECYTNSVSAPPPPPQSIYGQLGRKESFKVPAAVPPSQIYSSNPAVPSPSHNYSSNYGPSNGYESQEWKNCTPVYQSRPMSTHESLYGRTGGDGKRGSLVLTTPNNIINEKELYSSTPNQQAHSNIPNNTNIYGESHYGSAVQSTPYGRCTNLKMSSFVETSLPPVPPPLPPLSLFAMGNNSSGKKVSNYEMSPNNGQMGGCSPRGRHTTLPNSSH